MTGLEKEAASEEARADKVRVKKMAAEESKKMTVEDLTKGILNFQYVGLSFEKAEDQSLR